MMSLVYFERKVIARMQDRYGPNRVGPFGILQPVADAVKLLTKEDIVPAGADRLLFALSPIIVLGASLHGVGGDPVRQGWRWRHQRRGPLCYCHEWLAKHWVRDGGLGF